MVSTSTIGDFERNVMVEDPISSPDRALMRAELRALLERKLDALPDAFRVVFVLRCVEELSVEETPQCLGIPEATVRSRHFRARSMLRESLAQEVDRPSVTCSRSAARVAIGSWPACWRGSIRADRLARHTSCAQGNGATASLLDRHCSICRKPCGSGAVCRPCAERPYPHLIESDIHASSSIRCGYR